MATRGRPRLCEIEGYCAKCCERPASVNSYCQPCFNLIAMKNKRLREYGLTDEQYKVLLVEQRGKCGICEQAFIETPRVDHDHARNTVRGLLCNNCNTGIGKLGDSVNGLLSALAYLGRTM